MIPRDAWPLEPATRRAIAETVADGRHEWERAESMAAHVRAAARFTLALTRALAMASARECAAALHSPLAWRWLVIGAAMALTLPLLALLRAGWHLQRLPSANRFLVDVLVAFLVTTPISVYVAALSGRRDARVPVGGMAIFVGLFVALVLLLALPVVPQFFTQAIGGRLYVPVPLPQIVGFGAPCVIVCLCALLVADSARRHERRAFVSILGVLLPIAAITIELQLKSWMRSSSARPLGGWDIAEPLLAAALALAVLQFVLVRGASHTGAGAAGYDR